MNNENKYELIKFKDGEFSLDVNVSPNEDTVWLTLEEIWQLFERDRSVIGKHVNTILNNLELNANSVRANFAHTGSDGKTYFYKEVEKKQRAKNARVLSNCWTYTVDVYNLNIVLAVGYKENSKNFIINYIFNNTSFKFGMSLDITSYTIV